MDKTLNINLGGTLFQIDEEAYHILRDYLKSIDQKFRNVPGGNETIEDIEFRVAEIFLSKKDTAGVISKENVEEMIATIGKPEDFEQAENEAQIPGYNASRSRKMFRNPDNSIAGGVCGGIGTYLGTDPVWIRILFVISAFFFLFGLFVYLALWIALPSADTDAKKKEMYGSTYRKEGSQNLWSVPPYQTTSKAGNAVNEVFRAIGKVCFIIVRVILIIIGTCLVITGFLALLSFVMVFVFKYPGAFSTDAVGFNIAYVPDFLNFIVTPKAAPWIKGLIAVVVSLPLLALIYGGVRMIFWFRARDGYIWLGGFVVWVLCAAALSIVLFDEGVSYGDNERTITKEYLKLTSDTLYIEPERKLSDLITAKEITLPDEGGHGYNIFISEEKKEIYIKTHLDILTNEENSSFIEITKHSAGRNRLAAIENSKRLKYDYRLSNDTLYLDEFFSIPPASKWSLDFISLKVCIPEGTIVHIDKDIAETILLTGYNEEFLSESEHGFWKMTGKGPYYYEPCNKIDK